MKVLQRYVAFRFIEYFLFWILLSLGLMLMGETIHILNTLTQEKLHLFTLIRHLSYRTPFYSYEILPIIVLLTTFFLFSHFRERKELIATAATGLPLRKWRPSVTLILVTLMLCQAWTGEVLVPLAEKNDLTLSAQTDNFEHEVHGISILLNRENYLNASRIDFRHKTIDTGTLLIGFDSARFTRIEFGQLRFVRGGWQLQHGHSSLVDLSHPEKGGPIPTPNLSRLIPPPEQLRFILLARQSPELYSFREIGHVLRARKRIQLPVRALQAAQMQKLAYPFLSLLLGLLGINIAIHPKVHNKLTGVAITLLTIVIFWMVFALSNALAGLPFALCNYALPFFPHLLCIGALFFTRSNQ